jgi:hypothetical protein
MIDPIRELKIRAEVLHHGVTAGAPSASERLRALPELRRADSEGLATFVANVQRKHCLAVVARESGFQTWEHASRVIAGEASEAGETDYGELLSPKGASTFLNHWFASYDEARAVHVEQGGYLLAYKRHCFIAGRDYVAVTLRLDPDDADWAAIGFDWLRPRDPGARRRLYGKLLATKREAA